MSARRCSDCGINYPPTVTQCRVCQATTWLATDEDPDETPPEAPLERTVAGDDFFDKWSEDGDLAYKILAECEIPPSLEVFEHGLEAARERSSLPIPIIRYARMIVDAYQRVT